MREESEILAEITRLKDTAKHWDTRKQNEDTCVAAGAHDALRWALGLSEESVSQYVEAG